MGECLLLRRPLALLLLLLLLRAAACAAACWGRLVLCCRWLLLLLGWHVHHVQPYCPWAALPLVQPFPRFVVHWVVHGEELGPSMAWRVLAVLLLGEDDHAALQRRESPLPLLLI